jgi:imidazoleglycerol-phosphate dehydratase/histidinol-phosphatase
MKKVLFLDRDGLLIVEPTTDQQVDSLEKLEFIPGVFTWLGKIARDSDFELVMVTNQDGLGTSSFPEETFWPAHRKMIKALANEGIHFHAVHIDRSLPYENKPTRKPGTAMLTNYLTGDYDLTNSWVVGDRITDVELAKNLGANAILYNDGALQARLREFELHDTCKLITSQWSEIAGRLLQSGRSTTVHRRTRETEVTISVDLDGSGQSQISTGLPFFDHMLDQLARHGLLDLRIHAKGDLHIDEHHTIEDTALTLGEAIRKALGSKRGIERYGFCLPMDDCLAQVAIDFGGRPWLVWEAEFRREKIGDMPTEMFVHFFKSFSDTARCNLNIKAEGINEHHKVEAIFKAFAKSIRMAVKREGNHLPSTKGVI